MRDNFRKWNREIARERIAGALGCVPRRIWIPAAAHEQRLLGDFRQGVISEREYELRQSRSREDQAAECNLDFYRCHLDSNSGCSDDHDFKQCASWYEASCESGCIDERIDCHDDLGGDDEEFYQKEELPFVRNRSRITLFGGSGSPCYVRRAPSGRLRRRNGGVTASRLPRGRARHTTDHATTNPGRDEQHGRRQQRGHALLPGAEEDHRHHRLGPARGAGGGLNPS